VKVGADDRTKLLIAAVVLIGGIWAMYRAFTAPSTSTQATVAARPNPAPANANPAQPRRRERRGAAEPKLEASLDPTLRLDLLKGSEDREYSGAKRNIFKEYEPPPPPIPKPIISPTTPRGPVATGPPPPPPIPLKFYGFASHPGEPKKVFLSSNEGDVFIGGEGDIVDRRYKIVKITNSSVEIEDVLNNNKQTLPLSQG
jgi:hypothetical protein